MRIELERYLKAMRKNRRKGRFYEWCLKKRLYELLPLILAFLCECSMIYILYHSTDITVMYMVCFFIVAFAIGCAIESLTKMLYSFFSKKHSWYARVCYELRLRHRYQEREPRDMTEIK